jgi:hypothetical protein
MRRRASNQQQQRGGQCQGSDGDSVNHALLLFAETGIPVSGFWIKQHAMTFSYNQM